MTMTTSYQKNILKIRKPGEVLFYCITRTKEDWILRSPRLSSFLVPRNLSNHMDMDMDRWEPNTDVAAGGGGEGVKTTEIKIHWPRWFELAPFSIYFNSISWPSPFKTLCLCTDNTLTAPSTPTNLSRRLETQDSENDTDQDIKNMVSSLHTCYSFQFTAKNQYRKLEVNNPRKGIARSHS